MGSTYSFEFPKKGHAAVLASCSLEEPWLGHGVA